LGVKIPIIPAVLSFSVIFTPSRIEWIATTRRGVVLTDADPQTVQTLFDRGRHRRGNSPTGGFILSRPHWVRNLIAPTAGRALVHGDIVGAEAGISADLSGDPELIRIYTSGADQYIEFAMVSGALPLGAVRDKKNVAMEKIRDLYKTALLAIQYGVGADTLARQLGVPLWRAERIIASHKKAYEIYWRWANAQIAKAKMDGFIRTAFGWTYVVDDDTNHNLLLDFHMQAHCAEVLRLACVLCEERGRGPYIDAPHHDALYCDCPDDEAEDVASVLERCFRDASDVVLTGKLQLRLEAEIVRFPNHYDDDKGGELWKIVNEFLDKKSLETIAWG
jgi:DNA polymerase I-like protein with 3'-5' exonuclease and polymerase domains